MQFPEESPKFFCNNCLFPMKRGVPPFSLTQCRHLFCHSCSQKITDECLNCKSRGIEIMPLIEPLPPSIAKLFVPLSQLHATWENHMRILTEQHAIANESLQKNAGKLYKKTEIVAKANEDLRKRIEREKQEIELLKKKHDDLKKESDACFQEAHASNAPATEFSNVDNSHHYQMTPHPAQSSSRGLPHKRTPYDNGHRSRRK